MFLRWRFEKFCWECHECIELGMKRCVGELEFIIIIINNRGSRARLRESGIHPISPKTPAPQYQPIDGKKRKEKLVEDYSRD